MNKLHIALVAVLVAFIAILIPVSMGQDVAPSEGCAGLQGGTEITTYGPAEFVAGDKLFFSVSGAVTSWSVSVDGASVSGTLTGSQFRYTVSADGPLTIAITITGTGVGVANCTPAGETGSEGVICHIPPGNPDAAHTITVGAPAVKAHLNHGDFLGSCGEIESYFSDPSALEPFTVIVEDGATGIWGICTEGQCVPIALVDYETLLAFLEGLGVDEGSEASEGSEGSDADSPIFVATFDENTEDDWWVDVYYLGFQDRDGDGVFHHVFQINIYVANTLISDGVLILIDADDGVSWEENN